MENLYSEVDVLAALYSAYASATANGQKLSWTSLFSLGPVFMALPTAINNFNAAVTEAEGLTEQNIADLEAYIQTKLPSGSDNVAQYIKSGLDAVMKGVSAVQDVMAIVALAKGTTAAAVTPAVAPAVQSVGH